MHSCKNNNDKLKNTFCLDNNCEWQKIVYKAQIETIKHAKDTRWKIIYYILLLYSGIYYLNKQKALCGDLVGIIISILCIIGIYFIYKSQKDILLSREIVKLCYRNHGNLFIKDMENIIEDINSKCFYQAFRENGFKEDMQYAIIQAITIIVGAIILISAIDITIGTIVIVIIGLITLLIILKANNC
jgi:hypothetical protein